MCASLPGQAQVIPCLPAWRGRWHRRPNFSPKRTEPQQPPLEQESRAGQSRAPRIPVNCPYLIITPPFLLRAAGEENASLPDNINRQGEQRRAWKATSRGSVERNTDNGREEAAYPARTPQAEPVSTSFSGGEARRGRLPCIFIFSWESPFPRKLGQLLPQNFFDREPRTYFRRFFDFLALTWASDFPWRMRSTSFPFAPPAAFLASSGSCPP